MVTDTSGQKLLRPFVYEVFRWLYTPKSLAKQGDS